MENDRKHDKSTSAMVQIIVAVLSLAGVLGAAVISNWDKLFPQRPSTQISSEANKAAAPSTASKTHPLPLPATMFETKGPLFIVVPPDAGGTAIGARITDELQREGFRIAKSRDGAKLLIEIQAPNLGSTQASQVGSLESFSVTATLTARMFLLSNSTGNVIPMQRQALGLGATEVEARQNSIVAVTDRLGKSIADTLR